MLIRWGVPTGVDTGNAGGLVRRAGDEISVPYTANHTFTTGESGTIAHNTGATAATLHTLPAAISGLRYGAYITTAYQITLQAVGSDVIKNGNDISAAAGTIASSTAGNFVRLSCVVDGTWMADGMVGDWTLT